MAALRTAYLRYTIATCNEIEAEVSRTLKTKFGWEPQSTANMMRAYLDIGLHVQITGTLKNVCRDANDDMVVECALVAKAQRIVSGDKDLLSLGMYAGIRVLSPADFVMQ